ncbi:hypothetical protein [Acetobacter indonesiensis]|uniref:Uncharacterized protein n=1 Tax=Acetobacter indonesiensis TaxID=104101 RepID=A0A252ANJ0_9PROT|nr:hypothetical protein [Acetobacter indonesiensis]OUI91435.1 hypothetical protein HK17_11635 [Acetobacter indonesiensis]
MSGGVTVSKDGVPALLAAIKDLTLKRVMVGVPAENAERPDEKANNALIGYVLETGDPSRNLPARPFLVPGVQSVQEEAERRLEKAGKSALEGRRSDVQAQLTSVGLICAAAVKDKMDTGPFAPLADATLRARIRAKKGGDAAAAEELANRKAGQPPGTELVPPLYDTGNLQNSVAYVIRDIRTRR